MHGCSMYFSEAITACMAVACTSVRLMYGYAARPQAWRWLVSAFPSSVVLVLNLITPINYSSIFSTYSYLYTREFY